MSPGAAGTLAGWIGPAPRRERRGPRGAGPDAAPARRQRPEERTPGRVVSEAFLELQRALGELQAMEIVLRDLERGLVDFPAMRDGEEIYLCWEEGEDEIAFWHDQDSGYAGRRPL